MQNVALIGANGFVGKRLAHFLENNPTYNVRKVTRNNYYYFKNFPYDIVINAAMPSKRFWAKNNPQNDFLETVIKTERIINTWKYKKFVQISTISARTETDSVYGRHKAAAEQIALFDNNLILRLGAMFDETLNKGVLIDILDGKKVYVSGKSRYGFASLDFVTNWIAQNLDKKGIQEVGAKNSISLEKIISHFHLQVPFEGRVDIQEVQDPLPEFPDAKEVLHFLEKKLR